jgi:quercetin dioxygenase-like cupin family protein
MDFRIGNAFTAQGCAPPAGAVISSPRTTEDVMDLHTVDWSKMEWQKVRPGIERKAFTGQGATMSLNRIWPGHEPNPHSHHHEQLLYIIEGEIDLVVAGQTYRMGPGSLMCIPPHVEHYAKAVIGTKPCLNLDVFSPARPEYVA